MKISIPTRVIYFNKDELDNWVMGNREDFIARTRLFRGTVR
ncbi:hypothetical protein GCM10011389_22990 [Pontibacillus salipaludis]|uniref:Uncharacterized protein n=1 Tax=Pontibacillus salipaludis TaxID=1697394 RepID=A0ABQ1Q5Z2_9BACI|nr:hypothetical protein GCM10011389_22990 [Pontibacillus salipaludis]